MVNKIKLSRVIHLIGLYRTVGYDDYSSTGPQPSGGAGRSICGPSPSSGPGIIVTAGMLRRFFLIVAAVTVLSCGPLWAQSHDAVEKATKDTLRQIDLQLELPRGVEPFRANFQLPQEVVWVALICAAALILYSFRDLIPFWRQQAANGWDTQAAESGEARLEQPAQALRAADELGREGRFVEAMHMLLIQSLADIRQYLGEQFADSLTSREILRGVRLPVDRHPCTTSSQASS